MNTKEQKNNPLEKHIKIILAGNPNVGKSTLFNLLTGMNQHTGNWAGKTVENAIGRTNSKNHLYTIIDTPGTYSLAAHSPEEEIARNYICFSDAELTAVICDATCLERNLNFALQCISISKRTIVILNMMDEAKRKGISIDIQKLQTELGVCVIGVSARHKNAKNTILDAFDKCIQTDHNTYKQKGHFYSSQIEEHTKTISRIITSYDPKIENTEWISLQLLRDDKEALSEINKHIGYDLLCIEGLNDAIKKIHSVLSPETTDTVSTTDIVNKAADIVANTVTEKDGYKSIDIKLDRFFTGKISGYLCMFIMLVGIFWLTVVGANYPSRLISQFFVFFEDKVNVCLICINTPDFIREMIVFGMLRVVGWVLSVMLAPMAIFFPLFTILEDCGYLPRVAYNLDAPFHRCNACGKQALTMCMGFGCNAVGVTGARIIDSPRERYLAILTNAFVPCNGRLPAIITMISLFIIGNQSRIIAPFFVSVVLATVFCISVAMTFFITLLLSKTCLKGYSCAYTLELPPYRVPQIKKTVVRSLFDRTLKVALRAVYVAAPAGVIIFIVSNVSINGTTILKIASDALDPLGSLMGLDGVILLAFLLGFPANETVIPIMLMAYMSSTTLVGTDNSAMIKETLLLNGWNITTVISFIVFTMFHFPCSTTTLTIHKETNSMKMTALSVLLPTAVGIICCIIVNLISSVLHAMLA